MTLMCTVLAVLANIAGVLSCEVFVRVKEINGVIAKSNPAIPKHICIYRCLKDMQCIGLLHTEAGICGLIHTVSGVGTVSAIRNRVPHLLAKTASNWVAPTNWRSGLPIYYHGFENSEDFTNYGATHIAGHVGNSAIQLIRSQSDWVDFGISASAANILLPETCTNGGSMSIWMKIGACERYYGIMGSYHADKTGFSINCHTTSTIRTRLATPTGLLGMVFTYPTGWFHLVTVAGPSANNLTVYTNGMNMPYARNLPPKTRTSGPGGLVIGRYYATGDLRYVDVDVDEMAFFNSELTQSDVTKLYNHHK